MLCFGDKWCTENSTYCSDISVTKNGKGIEKVTHSVSSKSAVKELTERIEALINNIGKLLLHAL